MTWRTWWLYLITETALSFSPGPAVLLVISQSLRWGALAGIWAATGIISANVVWFTLSAVGIGAVLVASGNWFLALRWADAAYLVVLAVKPFLAKYSDEDAEVSREAALPPGQLWRRGLILQLTNPKALMFFAALLPQFVTSEAPVGQQMVILGATSVVTEFPVLVLYAVLAGRASTWTRERRFSRGIDLVAGALLIAAAVGVAMVGK
jgi:threonine/homoserine/homoserine lactone efflux protein